MSALQRVARPPLGPLAVAAVDTTGQAADILALGRHLRDARERVAAADLPATDASDGLVVAGMGGSAVGARLALGLLADDLRRPFVVADGYSLPPWAGAKTLVLCSSYSGTTEETLACYEQARGRVAPVVVASCGGPLTERARADGVPVIRLPTGLQPRAAVGYSLVCALAAASLCGAAPPLRRDLLAAAALMDALGPDWGPEGPEDGPAKTLARGLAGLAPVVVGTGPTVPVAYRWKCQLNENAKVPAFWSALPEADHNEICGWGAAGEAGAFAAVFLEDDDDPPQVRRRVMLTADAAQRGARFVRRVSGVGTTRLQRLLSLVLLGDLVSLYVAVLRGADPADIRAIRELKTALAVTPGG
jgi:glucose/mannose-6-phosphate isomerase